MPEKVSWSQVSWDFNNDMLMKIRSDERDESCSCNMEHYFPRGLVVHWVENVAWLFLGVGKILMFEMRNGISKIFETWKIKSSMI